MNTEAQADLKESLKNQQEEMAKLLEGEKELADLQGLMCELGNQGQVLGSKPACSAKEKLTTFQSIPSPFSAKKGRPPWAEGPSSILGLKVMLQIFLYEHTGVLA